jgi:molybdopterin-containing oxidoreductase family membrane subunit
MFGPYGWSYWLLIFINGGLVQLLWLKSVRLNTKLLFVLSLIFNVGMWFERFVIVVTSLARDFLPSSWGNYYPTFWDYLTYFGTIGLFVTMFFLFIKFVPMISMFEVRTLLPQAKTEHGPPAGGGRAGAEAH